ncbi:MAG: NAD-dependent epimerase/dehydratase family protein [Candidatus Gastranaerophilales bacterium]|nr:NAD-dependent epimerase/dehydratase family protein [Candidatus Gastranaerophilales bacterium]
MKHLNKSKILLTGATGFIGSHLLHSLIKNGYYVIVLKRAKSNLWRINKISQNTNVEIIDIDTINLETIFVKNDINTIIHCATDYGRGKTEVVDILQSNLIFPLRLLEYAKRHNVKVFINTDSYFNKQKNIYSFLSSYCLSKRNFVQWLKQYSGEIKIINVILEHVFGENDNDYKFVETAIKDIAIDQINNYDATLGQQIRDFIYINDVTNAYLKILEYSQENDFSYETFNVGTGIGTNIKDFLLAIKEASHSSTNIKFGAIPYRDNEIMYSTADISNLNKLNWHPQTDLDSTLKKIINLYKERENDSKK